MGRRWSDIPNVVECHDDTPTVMHARMRDRGEAIAYAQLVSAARPGVLVTVRDAADKRGHFIATFTDGKELSAW